MEAEEALASPSKLLLKPEYSVRYFSSSIIPTGKPPQSINMKIEGVMPHRSEAILKVRASVVVWH